MDNNAELLTKEEILKELATLDPLDDDAFRLLAADDEQFIALSEAILKKKLDEDKVIAINGEISLFIRGKCIRLDSLRDTNIGYIGKEGQINARRFPLKRHILYVSVIYAYGIKEGEDYQVLKPAICIVLYKDKGDAALIETASLSGSLIKTDEDKDQLQLISINTKKWRDAPTEELRAYFSCLHNGIITEENKSDFDGVNIDSPVFTSFQRAIRRACAEWKKEDHRQKGENDMAAKYTRYISEEERLEAEARGEARGKAEGRMEGKSLSIQIFKLLKEGVPVQEISKRLKVTPKEVEEFRIAL